MDISAQLIQGPLLWLGHGLFALMMIIATHTAPWYKIRDSQALHVFLGAVVSLMLLWTLRASVEPGFNFHFLGATVLTLMFGWQFALFGICLIVAATALNGHTEWSVISWNSLLMGAIPIAITHFILRLAQRRLPHNYFIYIFLNAFIAAGISSLAVAISAYGLYRFSGIYPPHLLNHQYLPFMLLIALPEATLNGMLMTGTVIYKPHWVSSFHDRWYLHKK